VVSIVPPRASTRSLRALLERPSAEVAAVLAADWDRFTDPATPTSELLARAGVPGRAGAVPVAAGEPGMCP
jgi:hypothetical protein